jgi:hypothetical protein
MPNVSERLTDGWQRALDTLPLALVPLLFALADVDELRTVVAFEGFHVGFRLGLPVSVVSLWQFVSLPQSGVNVDAGVPLAALPVAVVSVPVLLVAQAALAAGYFGSIADSLRTGEYRFRENAVEHFRPFLVLTVLPVLVLLPFALGLFGLGAAAGHSAVAPVLLVGVPAFVFVTYLFFATPYLVVLRETTVLDAARGSYALAVAGGPYLAYAAGVACFVLLVSPVTTVLVVGIPVVGLPVGLAVGSVVGLAVNTATMRVVADVDDNSPALGLCVGDDADDTNDDDEAGDGS